MIEHNVNQAKIVWVKNVKTLEENIFFWEGLNYHKQVFELFQSRNGSEEYVCLGGGYIRLDSKKNIVYLWDKSYAYGAFNNQSVKALVKILYPNSKILLDTNVSILAELIYLNK